MALAVGDLIDADADKAIKVMESKVGPLRSEDIIQLRDLLKSADVRDRLAAEQERVAKATAAAFDPPSPAIGAALFTGRTALAGGGVACISCHADVEGMDRSELWWEHSRALAACGKAAAARRALATAYRFVTVRIANLSDDTTAARWAAM